MRRLRPLTEAECYARCYGDSEGAVRIVKLEPRKPRYDFDVSGERLRIRFEELLNARPDAEAV